MAKILTRTGDGYKVEMTEDEVRRDIEEGTNDAPERAGISPLTQAEMQYLLDLYKNPDKVVGVESGKEVCMSYDNMASKIRRAHMIVSRIQSLHVFERALGADTLELSHIDYSYKQVKPIVGFESADMDLA